MEWNLPARLDEIDATGLQTWKDNYFIIIVVDIVIIFTYGIIFESILHRSGPIFSILKHKYEYEIFIARISQGFLDVHKYTQ